MHRGNTSCRSSTRGALAVSAATVVAHARRGRLGIQRLRELVVDAEVPHSDFERMVALELEGCDHRLRSKVHDDDTERQNWITLAGFTVLRTTYKRWIRHTLRVLREIETALTAARGEPRAGTTPSQWQRPTESGLWVPLT